MKYEDFLKSKEIVDQDSGIGEPADMNPLLFDWQADIVRWALRRGRAAIWADCGLGKTFMQLEWARHVPGRVLILAPLAVTSQTVREAERFGLDATYLRADDPAHRVVVSNYEMLDHFDADRFDGIVLDESSILKSYMGKTKRTIVTSFAGTRFRLACTATPAPNDHMELGNHAEFLGAMGSSEMLARWFLNDTMHAGNYRLKKHGEADFWRWVAGWAVALGKPSDLGDYSDDGFILPPMRMEVESIQTDPPEGQLFHVGGNLSATQIHSVKRTSAADRAAAVARFASSNGDQCLVWCDTNYEADAITPLIPGAVEIRGSDSISRKENALTGFAEGRVRVLVTKPGIAGFGMNFQNCHRVAFVGLSYSYESMYQAIRRVWRFGQESPVDVLVVESDAEGGIRQTVERKMEAHSEMQARMVEHMSSFQLDKSRKLKHSPEPRSEEGNGWVMWNGDCVEATRAKVSDESIDFSIFSPPFANLYIYSDGLADMGNSADHSEFFTHFGYMIDELLRITVNGRLCAVHCKDLPAYKGRDGAAGLIDFPGDCIKAFSERGWQYHSRVTIWKDPVTEMQRTKNHGLLHKQLCKDSSASRQGMADYVIVFRKWAGEDFPNPVHGPSRHVRFDGGYVGEQGPENVASERDNSIQVWQRYASPVWFDINQMRVLQGKKGARTEADERHICPLQLDVIRRCIHLWTNEGDTVFSPFAGIGSEGHVALEMERDFVGIELKRSYFEQAVRNLKTARKQMSLLP